MLQSSMSLSSPVIARPMRMEQNTRAIHSAELIRPVLVAGRVKAVRSRTRPVPSMFRAKHASHHAVTYA